MKRSIVKQGAATLMISLPSKWARRYNLKKGDEIDVIEKGKELMIAPEMVADIKKKTINISELNNMWRRVISALYKAGWDEIEMLFNKPEEIKKVYSILQEFVGFEIVTQTDKGCTIKEIVEAKETNFNTILGRTFNILSSIADDCCNALKNKNTELLGTIPERDLIINKYANFCRRIINKGLVEQKDAQILYFIIEELENLGDLYKSFSLYIYNTKKIPSPKIIKILDQINASIAEFHSALSRFDKNKVMAFDEDIKKIRKSLETTTADVQTINYLGQMINKFNNLVGPLLTMNSEKL